MHGPTPALLASLLALSGCTAASTGDGGLDPTSLDQLYFAGNARGTTDALLVERHGQRLYERYAQGADETHPHLLYSVSKSVTALLVAAAIDDGLLAPTDSVCAHVTPPAGADATLCDTTVDQLLHMTSGLQWRESNGVDPTGQDIEMLYGDVGDMAAFYARQPRASAPGSDWVYSSGSANLVMAALRGALGPTDVMTWARGRLFSPLGLRPVWERDRAGTPVASSSLFLTARELARVGELVAEGGLSPDGGTLLSPARIAELGKASSAEAGYGALWWLGYDWSRSPEVPTLTAIGVLGQYLVVVPDDGLVIVRFANDRADSVSRKTLLEDVRTALGTP
jgi:hypothetical protein